MIYRIARVSGDERRPLLRRSTPDGTSAPHRDAAELAEMYGEGIKGAYTVILVRCYWIRNGIGDPAEHHAAILDSLYMIRAQTEAAIPVLAASPVLEDTDDAR